MFFYLEEQEEWLRDSTKQYVSLIRKDFMPWWSVIHQVTSESVQISTIKPGQCNYTGQQTPDALRQIKLAEMRRDLISLVNCINLEDRLIK